MPEGEKSVSACEQSPMCILPGDHGAPVDGPLSCGLSPSLPPWAPPAGKRSEMLCSPLHHCFQGRRLLVIDLQPCYKSRAEGSLPRWLSTAASILHGSASLVASKGGFNHSLPLPDGIWVCNWFCHAPCAAHDCIYRQFLLGSANPCCGLQLQGKRACTTGMGPGAKLLLGPSG